jgi:hypothetical protein
MLMERGLARHHHQWLLLLHGGEDGADSGMGYDHTGFSHNAVKFRGVDKLHGAKVARLIGGLAALRNDFFALQLRGNFVDHAQQSVERYLSSYGDENHGFGVGENYASVPKQLP